MKKSYYYMTVIFMFSIMLMFGNDVSAESIDSVKDEINQIEKEQNALKKEQGTLNSNKENTEDKMNSNKEKQGSVQGKLETINNKLNSTQSSIDKKEVEIGKTNKEITKIEKQIKNLKKEIKRLQKRIKERDALLKNRLVSIQKNGGNIRYLEVIFGAQNFADFISRASAVSTIMDQDKLIMEIHTNDKKSLENKKVVVEEKRVTFAAEKKALESQKSELVALKSTLDSQKAEQSSLMAQLEVEYDELEEYKLTIEEETKVMAAQTKALEKAKQVAVGKKSELELLAKKRAEEEERARLAALEKEKNKDKDKVQESNDPKPPINDTNQSGGSFIWPTQGRISSEYGYRLHPIYNYQKLHGGIDIANSTGTNVNAAASGVVISGYYMTGYGNAVMIAHSINGKSYTTVYAHLNSISVSPGQVVNQGETIGKMGSTGPSTGPHLHFEIHVGGFASQGKNTVNPRNFLP